MSICDREHFSVTFLFDQKLRCICCPWLLDLFTCCFLSSIDVNKPLDYSKSVERNENLWFGLNKIKVIKKLLFLLLCF